MSKSQDQLDLLLKAIANPARRKILQMVWKKKCAAGEIAESLDLAPASVSEHLKVLRKACWVTVEREGTWWYYRANHELMDSFLQLLSQAYPKT